MRASTLESGFESRDQVAGRVRRANVLSPARAGEFRREFQRQPRDDRSSAGRERHGGGVDVEDVARLHQDVGPAPQPGLGECHVHCARGQHGRDRQPEAAGRISVGEDQQLGAAFRSRECVRAEALDGGLQPGRTDPRIPRGVEGRDDAGPAALERPEQACEVGHERGREMDRRVRDRSRGW